MGRWIYDIRTRINGILIAHCIRVGRGACIGLSTRIGGELSYNIDGWAEGLVADGIWMAWGGMELGRHGVAWGSMELGRHGAAWN